MAFAAVLWFFSPFAFAVGTAGIVYLLYQRIPIRGARRAAALAPLAAASRLPMTLRYAIRPANPAAHPFHVVCRVRRLDASGQLFMLPAWVPAAT
jgi:hypothetical protein